LESLQLLQVKELPSTKFAEFREELIVGGTTRNLKSSLMFLYFMMS